MAAGDKHTLSGWQNAACGAVGGTCSRFVVAPFDVIKIRLQVQGPQGQCRGVSHVLKSVLTTDGLTVSESQSETEIRPDPPRFLSLSGVGTPDFDRRLNPFWTYYGLAQAMPNDTSRIGGFFRGATAGLTASIVSYPFDILRTRFALQGKDRVYTSLLQAIKSITTSEGIRGLSAGMWPSLFQVIPYMGVMFATYESLNRAMPTAGPFVHGGLAGITAKLCTYPLDTIRRRLQVQGPTRTRYVFATIPVYNSWQIMPVLHKITLEEGVRGLYKGIIPGLMKTAPSSAIALYVTETCREYLMGKSEV